MNTEVKDEQKKESGATEKLNDVLTNGNRLANKRELTQLQVKMWVDSVRRQLKLIYGNESEVLNLFPRVEGTMSSDAAHKHLDGRLVQLERFLEMVSEVSRKAFSSSNDGKIYIGHGHSLVWREVKDFVAERLRLPCDEFNREEVAGLTTLERLSQMVDQACFAFLIMTAEDEHADAKLHARENVVHEIGLFQGRLGPRKAIVLLEDGCQEFSNIHGLSQIRFPSGNVSAAFEQIRRVLERESIHAG